MQQGHSKLSPRFVRSSLKGPEKTSEAFPGHFKVPYANRGHDFQCPCSLWKVSAGKQRLSRGRRNHRMRDQPRKWQGVASILHLMDIANLRMPTVQARQATRPFYIPSYLPNGYKLFKRQHTKVIAARKEESKKGVTLPYCTSLPSWAVAVGSVAGAPSKQRRACL